MITDTFIGFMSVLSNKIIGFLPNGGVFPQVVHDAVIGLGNTFAMLSPIAPITTLAVLLPMVFAVELALFSWRTARWAFSFIPFFGGRG